jgi:hypothetical protein
MPSRYLTFGQKGTILLTAQDDQFLNGYRDGQLTYVRTAKHVQQTDITLTRLLVKTFDQLEHSDAYSAGFALGWLHTFAELEFQEAPDPTAQPAQAPEAPQSQPPAEPQDEAGDPERDPQPGQGESHEP